MDKAMFLQKQVRENSEDLQRELRDMLAWEEQMKKRDFEIRNATDDQVLPPVRSKKKKKTESTAEASKEDVPSKAKRIAGSDYTSWDKFDAAKACEEVEEKNKSNEKEETVFEIPSKEELEKEHAEATKYKEEGNALVKKQEYALAVSKYSQAIKIFPGDAVFYANRALCQLKLDNIYSADADCTAAIKLDEHYVKAYHRRALVRIELKRYDDAKKDLEKVLVLEPSNKEAASKLKLVEEKIEKCSKPLIISGEEKCQSSIEKAIGKKIFGPKSDDSQKDNKKSKPHKESQNKSVKVEQAQASTSKEKLIIEEIVEEKNDNTEKKRDQNVNTISIEKSSGAEKKKYQDDKNVTNLKKSNSVEKEKGQDIKNITNIEKLSSLEKSEKTKTTDDELPPWLPKLKESCTIVQPLKKAPQQSNKSLKRITIEEIPENKSIFADIIEDANEKLIETKEDVCQTCSNNKSENKNKNSECNHKKDAKEIESLPPPPKSSVAFLTFWRKNLSIDIRYRYLKQITPKNLSEIFKASMESSILSDILSILNTKFVPNDDKVYDWIYYLSKLERFKALILFLTQADKEALKSLFECCKTKEGRTDEEVNNLHSIYEM